MKVVLSSILVSSFVLSSHGFAAFVPRSSGRVSTSFLQAAAGDSVAYALEMSKVHGATSKEARLAWEAVEEVSASDNTAAFKGGLDEECNIVTMEQEQACKDYQEKMDSLSQLLHQQQEPIRNIEALVQELKGIKLPAAAIPATPEAADLTHAMRVAIQDAKLAAETFGADSVQAKLAWETVEEIAASNNSQAVAGALDDECLLELEEACATLQEVTRAFSKM